MNSMTSSHYMRYTSLFATGLTIEDVGFYGIAAAYSKLFNYTPLQVYGKFIVRVVVVFLTLSHFVRETELLLTNC